MPSVVLVGTYPPTACGIATFTQRLRSAIEANELGWRADVLRVRDGDDAPADAGHVVATWCPGDEASLDAAIAAIEPYDAVVVQHEYGIYGECDGRAVLDLVAGVDGPVVTVLHTVVTEPTRGQRQVLEALMARSDLVVVLSAAARERLLDLHEIDPERVALVPHGAAANFDGPLVRALPHPLALTWGLLGQGKGVEHGIRAIAQLARTGHRIHYLVVGRTHPKTHAFEGERYRDGLLTLSHQLGIDDLVHFDDGYHDLSALEAIIRTADVVVLPYDSVDQVTSGVLVEALASGKPVIATAFPHACEMLRRGAGVVVPHRDPGALASALQKVLGGAGERAAMGTAARRAAQPLLWPEVGATFRTLLTRVIERSVAA
jgi:glycosyltransferase involved in cell wall biosynthesis